MHDLPSLSPRSGQGGSGPDARRQWRSLLESPQAAARVHPALEPLLREGPARRDVLRLLAASVALGGLAGCDPAAPDRHLFPAPVAAPGIVPGRPNSYATTSLASGSALGITVTHQMGRPIKVEGNPLHPASLGATDALAQALVLDFYDPDRASGVLHGGDPSERGSLLAALAALRPALAASRGAGLRLLAAPTTSPTLGAALDAVLAAYPEARLHRWDAADAPGRRAGLRLAYGRDVAVVPLVDRADVILALDSDLLDGAPGSVRHARDFAARRNPARAHMSRVYAVEPSPTLIGTAGDHRFPADAATLQAVLRGLAATLLDGAAGGIPDGPAWLAPVLADLQAAHGRALVHAGPHLAPEAQALVHAVNEALGARGATLRVTEAAEHAHAAEPGDMGALLDDLHAGRVSALVVLGGNPAYAAPGFAEALPLAPFSLYSAPAPDETAALAGWFVPEVHGFERWGDARAFDGTASPIQPMSLPLHGGIDPVELLSLLTGAVPTAPLDALRATWRERLPDQAAWNAALAQGVFPGTASAPADVALRPGVSNLRPAPAAASAVALAPAQAPTQAVELLLRPDPYLRGDGRNANNAWLQELPRPHSKLVWDNPLLLSPQLARACGVSNGDEVELTVGTARVTLPAWIVPGQAATVAVGTLGYGRQAAGGVGSGVGTDLHPLLAAQDAGASATIRRTGHSVLLACTDHHDALAVSPEDTDPIVRHGTLAEFQARPDFLQGERHGETLYDHKPGAPVAWGMSVDLNSCIGCNACVVACMAENNVPVVGKTQVVRQREMHWLRIDRYYEGLAEDPETYFQPMLCHHCEEAPCEVVCPVGATVHDEEGLNAMVYNRCVGTRFCSNNCPYKVRRFNFLAFAREEERPPISRNPDVSVRGRGVMEKCTFCVQRIAAARIEHDAQGRHEEVVTACQAACPTRAFSFGDLRDAASEVAQRKRSPLDYVLLPERNTRPRLTYEARIRNPNPELPA